MHARTRLAPTRGTDTWHRHVAPTRGTDTWQDAPLDDAHAEMLSAARPALLTEWAIDADNQPPEGNAIATVSLVLASLSL